MTIFVNGKQKRVPRSPTIDGMPVDQFIAQNAHPLWLIQNEIWEYLHAQESTAPRAVSPDDPVPF